MKAGFAMWSASALITACGFLGVEAFNPGAVVAHHVKAFAPGMRVGAHDRVHDRRVALDLRLSRD
jgi:hypothetical protein